MRIYYVTYTFYYNICEEMDSKILINLHGSELSFNLLELLSRASSSRKILVKHAHVIFFLSSFHVLVQLTSLHTNQRNGYENEVEFCDVRSDSDLLSKILQSRKLKYSHRNICIKFSISISFNIFHHFTHNYIRKQRMNLERQREKRELKEFIKKIHQILLARNGFSQ